MLKKFKLCVDAGCEIVELLRPWVSETFYNFSQQSIAGDKVYIIGRVQLKENSQFIREAIEKHQAFIIFGNPHEGSETLMRHLQVSGLDDLARSRRLKIIGGGEMEPTYDYLLFDHFLPKLLDYKENIAATLLSEKIYRNKNKPYKFLFLNGRARSHRKYFVERLEELNLLEQSLWSWLDTSNANSFSFRLTRDGVNLMDRHRDIKFLEAKYESSRYRDRIPLVKAKDFVKYDLFKNEWGEIYLNPEAYIDTYFSLVMETVFVYPYSFRTEKIWKPIVMGQPWIAAANHGYYRDIKNLGFQTFGHLIDESFDSIENDQERADKIIEVVKDLCQSNLDQFIDAAQDVCKYNQEHIAHMSQKVRQEFPDRFFQWMT